MFPMSSGLLARQSTLDPEAALVLPWSQGELLTKSNKIAKEDTTTVVVEERRRRVGALLLKKVPVAEIARRESLSVPTIWKDVRALDDLWAKDHLADYPLKKARELEGLDRLEAKAVEQFETALMPVVVLNREGEPYHVIDYKLALSWWDRILAAKARRAKMLGFDMTEPIVVNLNEDNRSVTITVQDGSESKEFTDWLRDAMTSNAKGGTDDPTPIEGQVVESVQGNGKVRAA